MDKHKQAGTLKLHTNNSICNLTTPK